MEVEIILDRNSDTMKTPWALESDKLSLEFQLCHLVYASGQDLTFWELGYHIK